MALEHLQSKGYELVEKNWKCRVGELDIVMKKEGLLVFVEVRTLDSSEFDDPLASITRSKVRQVVRTAKSYLSLKPLEPDMDVRFDVVGVTIHSPDEVSIEHVPNAFDAPEDMFV